MGSGKSTTTGVGYGRGFSRIEAKEKVQTHCNCRVSYDPSISIRRPGVQASDKF